ncbi:hypothetical protein OIE66_32845 [Nonomuraea sp. NBC_01738]|uniref:hypothetical protein n=1 Tax=Nonomuraea sp. NBC_01738 TaxID=2976003 RepID=UPI002E1412CD|nr:hypothetical protein OIE66_32845 [Nonomuraea sp. NBC_01738]
MIPFEMIEEDLGLARERALRWAELAERRRLIVASVELVRHAGDRRAEARLVEDLEIVDRELSLAGPAREIYAELLARRERRLIESADPVGAELLSIGRALAELSVDSPQGDGGLGRLRQRLLRRREQVLLEVSG